MATLETLLRPAGQGVAVFSTGVEQQRSLSRRVYGVENDADVREAWRSALGRIAEAKVVVLGVPSDVGAGFVRGANFGPQEIRTTLLSDDKSRIHHPEVVDAGDVFVVPQLLHDEMISPEQRERSLAAVYGESARPDLPISPLSIAQAALRLIRSLAPSAAPLLLGGDHSVGWPGVAAVAAGREAQTGILHFDAHTDLLKERLGVRYCFATWAYHANELVGRERRLAQVGIRTSGKPRFYWEQTFGVRQYWMDEVRVRDAHGIADEIVSDFEAAGVQGLYISNDIDGTDPTHAAATGTPEPGGLEPETVLALIERVGARFPLWGSDLVEVAPTVGRDRDGEPQRTLRTAARYAEAQMALSLG